MKLHTQIMLAIFIGLFVGFGTRYIYLPDAVMLGLYLPGMLFVRALKMVVVPLVFASIVYGVLGHPNSETTNPKTGKLALATLTYYITTSLLAILTGLLLVNLVTPGYGVDITAVAVPQALQGQNSSMLDNVVSAIPTNPIRALVESDMIAIVVFAVLFGLAARSNPNTSKSIVTKHHHQLIADFFEATAAIMQRITGWIIVVAPLGIASLLIKVGHDFGLELLLPVAMYTFTVFAGLFIHACINMPLLLHFVAKTNPITMRALDDAKYDKKVTGFVIPLGATINMDGTALYECVAALFIAQAYGVSLTFADQTIVVITALVASIGAAGIPMAGLIMMSIILEAVGLPLEGIGLIIAVDRILDMLRTAVNVWSDSCGAAIIASKWSNQKSTATCENKG